MSNSRFEYLIEKLLFEDISEKEQMSIIKEILSAGRKDELDRLLGRV